MKYIFRVLLIIIIIAIFILLKSVFLRWEQVGEQSTSQLPLANRLLSALIDNGCRQDGLITKCFKATSESCSAIQKQALEACLKITPFDIKDLSEANKFSSEIEKTGLCAFQAFLDQNLGNLNVELEECRQPDMSKVFEIQKVVDSLR